MTRHIDEYADKDRPMSSRSVRRELMKKTIGVAKEMKLIKGGQKVMFMQESGTDNPTKNDDVPVDISYSYKKIVEVAE